MKRSRTETVNFDRRRFVGTAAVLAAAAEFGIIRPARASSGDSFDKIRQVQAGPLDIGYGEAGPADGRAVILLHGWPYDIHSYAEVTPILAAQGFRVIVPYLRGYGTTRFLSERTPSGTDSRPHWLRMSCHSWTP